MRRTLNHDGPARLIGVVGLHFLNFPHDALPRQDLAEDNVLLVEVGCGNGGDEKLTSIGACAI